jgi:hypothetical protein
VIDPKEQEHLDRLALGDGGVDDIENPPKDDAEALTRRKAEQGRHDDDAWTRLHPGRPMKPDFWDAQSRSLLENISSGLMAKLGSIPIVPDIRPAPDPRQEEFQRERESRARAGHSGDCGDM